jgi:hypothetical protein
MAAEGVHESSWAKAGWALAYYVVIPTIIVTTIKWRYPELEQGHLDATLRWVLASGMVIVGVSALRADFERGSRVRLALDASYVLLAIAWLLGVLGGDTVLEQSWQGHPFTIDITRLFVVVASLASLNLLHYALEYRAARERAGAESPARAPVVIEVPD